MEFRCQFEFQCCYFPLQHLEGQIGHPFHRGNQGRSFLIELCQVFLRHKYKFFIHENVVVGYETNPFSYGYFCEIFGCTEEVHTQY